MERQLARFDFVLLEMGPDGHTASLFPGAAALHEQKRLVVVPWVEKLNTYRLTLTPTVLNNADAMVLLVSGEDKVEMLRAVLEGDYQPDRLPSQVIRLAHGTLLWLMDRASARQLRIDTSAEMAASRPVLASESRGEDGPVWKSEGSGAISSRVHVNLTL